MAEESSITFRFVNGGGDTGSPLLPGASAPASRPAADPGEAVDRAQERQERRERTKPKPAGFSPAPASPTPASPKTIPPLETHEWPKEVELPPDGSIPPADLGDDKATKPTATGKPTTRPGDDADDTAERLASAANSARGIAAELSRRGTLNPLEIGQRILNVGQHTQNLANQVGAMLNRTSPGAAVTPVAATPIPPASPAAPITGGGVGGVVGAAGQAAGAAVGAAGRAGAGAAAAGAAGGTGAATGGGGIGAMIAPLAPTLVNPVTAIAASFLAGPAIIAGAGAHLQSRAGGLDRHSPEVMQAKVEAEIREMQANMRQADRIGKQVADLNEATSRLGVQGQRIKDAVGQAFGPEANAAADMAVIFGEAIATGLERWQKNNPAIRKFFGLDKLYEKLDELADRITGDNGKKDNIFLDFAKEPLLFPPDWPGGQPNQVAEPAPTTVHFPLPPGFTF